MKPSKIPNSLIDQFISDQWSFETPAYQAIVKERLSDLCRRDISKGEAVTYLKSAGWAIDFAVIYANFLSYVGAKNKGDIMSDTNSSNQSTAIPLPQVQQLLKELVVQLASSASFRSIGDGEDIKDYRKEFMAYLAEPKAGLDDTAKTQVNRILQELSLNLKRSDELVRTLMVFFQ